MRFKWQKYWFPSWRQKESFWRGHRLCLQFVHCVQWDYSGNQKARLLWLCWAKCNCSCSPSWLAPGGCPLMLARFLPICWFSAMLLLLPIPLVCHHSVSFRAARLWEERIALNVCVFSMLIYLFAKKNMLLIKMEKQDTEEKHFGIFKGNTFLNEFFIKGFIYSQKIISNSIHFSPYLQK